MSGKRHVAKASENTSPAPTAAAGKHDDIFSFKKHSMEYFTINGVRLRTGLDDPKDLYIMAIEELLDNAVDFLQKYYKGYSSMRITVYITKKRSVLHIKVRNTNQHVRVFQNLEKIFNPEMTYGSKQNLKIISRGLLGDAMKQILALAYILIHCKDDRTAFTNAQWNQPLIVRHNGLETHVKVVVDPATGGSLDIKEVGVVEGGSKDTEIEVFLPLIKDDIIRMDEIEEFCRTYPILTTDIWFKFLLMDDNEDEEEEETMMI